MPTFTRATPADLNTLITLVSDFYPNEHLHFAHDTITALSTLLAHPGFGSAYLIHENAALAGYFILTFGFSLERGGKTALLDEFFVLPAFRRRGLGTAALEFAISESRRANCEAILLEVDHSNTPAQALYRRAGFQGVDRHILLRLTRRFSEEGPP